MAMNKKNRSTDINMSLREQIIILQILLFNSTIKTNIETQDLSLRSSDDDIR